MVLYFIFSISSLCCLYHIDLHIWVYAYKHIFMLRESYNILKANFCRAYIVLLNLPLEFTYLQTMSVYKFFFSDEGKIILEERYTKRDDHPMKTWKWDRKIYRSIISALQSKVITRCSSFLSHKCLKEFMFNLVKEFLSSWRFWKLCSAEVWKLKFACPVFPVFNVIIWSNFFTSWISF